MKPYHSIVFIFLILSVLNCSYDTENIENISSDWYYTIGDPNDTYETVENLNFTVVPKEQLGSLEALLESGVGYLWLRKDFQWKAQENQAKLYSISPGRLAWSDLTFMNGQLIGKSGDYPPHAWSAWNFYRNYTIAKGILKDNETNTLLIKLYIEHEGFVYGDTLLGDSTDLESFLFPIRFMNTNVNAFIAFVFLVMSMYHLLIYFKRKKDVENWYYSLAVLFYALYCTNFFSDYFYKNLGVSYLTFQKFIMLCSSGMMYFIGRFFSKFFKMPISNILKYTYFVSIMLPTLISFTFTDYGILKEYRGILTIIQFLPTLVYILYCVLKGLINKNPSAKAMVFGLIPLSLVTVHDVSLVIFDIKGAIFLAGLGVPAFMGSIMFILASKFVQVQNETDDLNANLEKKVEERTAEVTQRMEEVQALKVQQDGDYFLTSLIESPLSTNFNKSKLVKTEFYINQKKKFTFRKKTAELGGDLCVTGNLRFGDGKDRWVSFFNGDAMGKSMQGAGGAIVGGTAINNILSRSAKNNRILSISPIEWVENTYSELDSIFKTFNGSMVLSCVFGLVNERSGEMFYFNAEHPWSVVYRDGKASFIESELTLRKLGSESEFDFEVKKYKLLPRDILLVGSDGRDDINMGESGERDLNEDETLFLRLVEEGKSDLAKIAQLIEFQGELTDDLSLMRIGFQEDYAVDGIDEDSVDFTIELAQDEILAGNRTKAKYILDTIWDKDKTNITVLKLLIKICFEDKKYGDTIDRINDFHKMNSDSQLFWFEKSVCHKQLQDYESAKQSGEVCRRYQPDRVANLINLADSYRMLGDEESARKILRDALDREPSNQAATKLANILSMS
ncbi:MAG: SpoIIE family protein phosphatase [Leptospira sp.]|nr:SpoIIE family protein phosphatase [Leptospira sp.]NCS92639.1 SpoIIE family protein phosphatase [Leptospira sp.]